MKINLEDGFLPQYWYNSLTTKWIVNDLCSGTLFSGQCYRLHTDKQMSRSKRGNIQMADVFHTRRLESFGDKLFVKNRFDAVCVYGEIISRCF
jgi:hypothetical protein